MIPLIQNSNFLNLDFLHPNMNGECDAAGYSSEEDSRYPPQMALTPIPASPVPPEDGNHNNPTRPPILPRFSFEVWFFFSSGDLTCNYIYLSEKLEIFVVTVERDYLPDKEINDPRIFIFQSSWGPITWSWLARWTWLYDKFSARFAESPVCRDLSIVIPGSRLTGLARFSCNHKISANRTSPVRTGSAHAIPGWKSSWQVEPAWIISSLSKWK